jgi:hypothetical protein
MTASGERVVRSPRHMTERPAVARVAGMIGVGVAAAAVVVASPSVLDPASQPRWVTMTPPPREAPPLELPRPHFPVPSAHPRQVQEPPVREERRESEGMPQSRQPATPSPTVSPTSSPTASPTTSPTTTSPTTTSPTTTSPTTTSPTDGEPPPEVSPDESSPPEVSPDEPSPPEETDPPHETDQESSGDNDEAADECLEPSLVDPEACPDPLGD